MGLHVARDSFVSHLKQLFFSQWVKYWSSPCVAFWDPGQRDFGSLGRVFLIIEGRQVLPEGQAKTYDAPNGLGRLGKGTLLFLSMFHWPMKITWPRPTLIEQTFPQWRQRRKKGNLCWKMIQMHCSSQVAIPKARFKSIIWQANYIFLQKQHYYARV